MSNELLYQIALSKIPNIGDVHSKTLINFFKEASAIFQAPRRILEKIEGIGKIRAQSIKSFKDFAICEREINFIQKNNITPTFFTSESYPKRLLHCNDAPILLFHKGNLNLQCEKIISIVGTRNHSSYGKNLCEKFVAELKEYGITIVSGLAHGIDTIAHETALQHQLPTIAVLAHGLDRIYPYCNTSTAIEMCKQGGLLTEFASGTNPDKQNFPKRNRITAGICDALIVIETGKKGGSLITAEIAHSYHKDIFTFPGRVTDTKSEGCNHLIKDQKAYLISNANDFIEMMNWQKKQKKKTPIQTGLFNNLNETESTIIHTLQQSEGSHILEIQQNCRLSSSLLSIHLLELELKGLIQSLPGNRFCLVP